MARDMKSVVVSYKFMREQKRKAQIGAKNCIAFPNIFELILGLSCRLFWVFLCVSYFSVLIHNRDATIVVTVR